MLSNRGKTGVCIAAGLTLLLAHGVRAAVSDPWITTKAKIVLLTSEGLSGSQINVDTINGEVTLHGKVATPGEKTKAAMLVRRIDGVGAVRNLLQVVPEEQRKRVTALDEEIRTRVEQTLAKHPALTDVSVQSVNDGVVLLAGKVKTLSAHLEAIKVTSQVPGVDQVASEIKSPNGLADDEIYSERAPTPAAGKGGVATTARDMWITSKVKLRLLADDRAPSLAVNVDTDGGRVTLFGRVGSEAAKAAVAEDALKVSGVTRVINDLQVVPTAKELAVKARDEDVEKHVEAAISRRDDLRDADIDVAVRDGIARLTGTVPTETQRLTAAVVARTTAGVRAVRDDLRIEAN